MSRRETVGCGQSTGRRVFDDASRAYAFHSQEIQWQVVVGTRCEHVVSLVECGRVTCFLSRSRHCMSEELRLQYRLRKATLDDRRELEALIARSIRQLGAGDYTSEQIEAALKGAFGVDTRLIQDGTYYVAEAKRRIVACGGWSRRRTLFGGDSHAQRDAGELDPSVDPAKIRAFFVDPACARNGIGTALLEHCEAAALIGGFRTLELMATLPGVRLYSARGYVPGPSVLHPLTSEVSIEFVPMTKTLPEP